MIWGMGLNGREAGVKGVRIKSGRDLIYRDSRCQCLSTILFKKITSGRPTRSAGRFAIVDEREQVRDERSGGSTANFSRTPAASRLILRRPSQRDKRGSPE
jgi:hypothetical protein